MCVCMVSTNVTCSSKHKFQRHVSVVLTSDWAKLSDMSLATTIDLIVPSMPHSTSLLLLSLLTAILAKQAMYSPSVMPLKRRSFLVDESDEAETECACDGCNDSSTYVVSASITSSKSSLLVSCFAFLLLL